MKVLPILDYSFLESIKELDPGEEGKDLLSELIGIFFKHSRNTLDELASGVKDRDALIIEKYAHKLKGSSGSLGGVQLADFCQTLENIGREKKLEGVDEAFESVSEAYTKFCQALNSAQS